LMEVYDEELKAEIALYEPGIFVSGRRWIS
jgi:hypothetical protein